MARFAVPVLAAVLLAACGHGGREPVPPVPPPPATTAIAGRALTVGFPIRDVRPSRAEGRKAAEAYLRQHGDRAGPHTVSLVFTDVYLSSAFDADPCGDAARTLQSEQVVAAVTGPGCDRDEALLLHVPDPPLLVTTVGAPGIASGDPGVLRVGATWADEGEAAARYATTILGRKRCLVLEDGEAIGRAARARFAAAAGEALVGTATWEPRARHGYRAFLRQFAALRPDCVYLAGIADNNGLRLIADVVAVFGPADGPVRLLAGGGFAGYSFAWTGAEQGLILVTRQIPPQGAAGTPGRSLTTDDIPAQLAALQVILDAIARSDGTRSGVAQAALAAKPVDTPLGPLSFDPATGEQVDKQAGIWEARGSEERFVRTIPVR